MRRHGRSRAIGSRPHDAGRLRAAGSTAVGAALPRAGGSRPRTLAAPDLVLPRRAGGWRMREDAGRIDRRDGAGVPLTLAGSHGSGHRWRTAPGRPLRPGSACSERRSRGGRRGAFASVATGSALRIRRPAAIVDGGGGGGSLGVARRPIRRRPDKQAPRVSRARRPAASSPLYRRSGAFAPSCHGTLRSPARPGSRRRRRPPSRARDHGGEGWLRRSDARGARGRRVTSAASRSARIAWCQRAGAEGRSRICAPAMTPQSPARPSPSPPGPCPPSRVSAPRRGRGSGPARAGQAGPSAAPRPASARAPRRATGGCRAARSRPRARPCRRQGPTRAAPAARRRTRRGASSRSIVSAPGGMVGLWHRHGHPASPNSQPEHSPTGSDRLGDGRASPHDGHLDRPDLSS